MDHIDSAIDDVLHGTVTGDGGETVDIEFKTDGRSLPDDLALLADAASCMANSSGGTIVVGVSDKLSGAEAFKGTRLDPEKVRLRIYELTNPPLLVEAESRRVLDVSLVVLRVPDSTQVHSANGQIPSERVDKHCKPMSTARIAAVIAQKTGLDWSAGESGIPVKQVDPLAMRIAREFLNRATEVARRQLADAGDIDLLRALGVVQSEQTLTNAGALLFVPGFIPHTLISYTHRRTPAGQLTANEHLAGPLIVAIDRVFNLIDVRLERTPVTIGKGQQLHVADLPEAAVREAVVNALMHRDYFSHEPVAVEHAVTQLRATSPGGFPPGVSIHNVLTTSSRTRNANLAGAMRMLGLAETAGSGVDKMYAEMTRIGHEPPRYAADTSRVQVTLLGGSPNTLLTRFTATLPTEESTDADTMLVLLTLLTHRTVDAAELTPVLQKPEIEETQSVLARLSGERLHLLEPTRESARRAHPRYRLREEALTALGSAVTYRRRTTDQIDRKIIELVRETGTINSRMVRILLDLDMAGASRVLSNLVDRGVLTKTSEASRGPSVTYGKGPTFPRRTVKTDK
ncbi:ATP-binding protein [Tessaracoccus caeni]|uniref:ATP-binding protein n=1 Tax=Tessaracoccus caeni TaxID=3031239 RepID=UPI0023DAE95A|nr:ATP-binding protein [Tessaracoccus caeni]MDF1488082.1 ATP-binding protein [Tessaracoccus caeni]